MKLHIITPRNVVFEGEVDAVTVPGRNGEFQMLDNHAPIVSSLDKGTIKIKLHSKEKFDFESLSGELKKAAGNEHVYLFDITGGVVEMSNNEVTILAN